MQEFVVRFTWRGERHEQRVNAPSEDWASAEIARQHPGCRIVSVLCQSSGAEVLVPPCVGNKQGRGAQAGGQE